MSRPVRVAFGKNLTNSLEQPRLTSQKKGDAMKTTWKLQDAKSQFSKLVKEALQNGPQYVTRRGVEAVVVVSVCEYEKLTAKKPKFTEFLLSCPKQDDDFQFERLRDFPKGLDL